MAASDNPEQPGSCNPFCILDLQLLSRRRLRQPGRSIAAGIMEACRNSCSGVCCLERHGRAYARVSDPMISTATFQETPTLKSKISAQELLFFLVVAVGYFYFHTYK